MNLCSEQMQLLATSRSNYICLEKEPEDLPILYVISLCSTKKHMKKYYDFDLSSLEKSRTITELKQLRGLMITTSSLFIFCANVKSGDINHAKQVFNQIEVPSLYIWNSVNEGYSNSNNPN
ncbi:putative pentatricopeptide repeat-containing protein [Quercus suber]|uniref:Pentatricopeptide repeat-containing protein n=1 Tax=Quercus suber TaxID=58331 RepID=A0AAW0JTZ9_QUESU